MSEDLPPPIPVHLRQTTAWWSFPVPIWSVAALLLSILCILVVAQRPIVETLWRKHHPDIDNSLRRVIEQREKQIALEKDAEELRLIEQVRGMSHAATPTWEEQNAQFNKERAERRERLGLPPLPQLKQPE